MSITGYVYDNLENVHFSVVKKKIVSNVTKRGKSIEDESYYNVNDVGLKRDIKLQYDKEFYEQYREELVTNKGVVLKMRRNYSEIDTYGFEVQGDKWYLREEQQKKWEKPGVIYGYNLNKKNKEAFKEIQKASYNKEVRDSFIPIKGELLYKVKGVGYVVKSCDSLMVLPYKESIVNYIFLAKKHWYKYAMKNVGVFIRDYDVLVKKIDESLLLGKDIEVLTKMYYKLGWFMTNISWLLSLYQILYKKAKKKNKIIIKSFIYGYSYIAKLSNNLEKILLLNKGELENQKDQYKNEKSILGIKLNNIREQQENNKVLLLKKILEISIEKNTIEDIVLLKTFIIIKLLNTGVKELKVSSKEEKNKYMLLDWVEGNRKLNVITRKLLKLEMLSSNTQLLELGKKKEKEKKEKKEKRKYAAVR